VRPCADCDQDVEIETAVAVDVSDAACKNAPRVFSSSRIFSSSHLGQRYGAAGKHQRALREHDHPWRSLPQRWIRCDAHGDSDDVIRLHFTLPGCTPSQVVAFQVDQHEVFRRSLGCACRRARSAASPLSLRFGIVRQSAGFRARISVRRARRSGDELRSPNHPSAAAPRRLPGCAASAVQTGPQQEPVPQIRLPAAATDST